MLVAAALPSCGDRVREFHAAGRGRPEQITTRLDLAHDPLVPVRPEPPVRPVPAPRPLRLSTRAPAPTIKPTDVPIKLVGPYQTARASWYDYGHRGGFAHRTMAKGTRVEFCLDGRCVIARCMGWGPAAWTGRDFDLDRVVFETLAPTSRGVITVQWRLVS